MGQAGSLVVSFELFTITHYGLHQEAHVAELRVLGAVLDEQLTVAVQLGEDLRCVFAGDGIGHVDGQKRLIEIPAMNSLIIM